MAYTISKKAQDNLNIFFNEYCKNCKGLTNINDVINKAVKLSYRASVLRALYDGDKLVGFNGMTSQKNNARSAGENILQNFLSATHSNGNIFQVVKDTWDAIRENYHNQGITWYTYGNAQKWVSMAIKYFVVICRGVFLTERRKYGMLILWIRLWIIVASLYKNITVPKLSQKQHFLR